MASDQFRNLKPTNGFTGAHSESVDETGQEAIRLMVRAQRLDEPLEMDRAHVLRDGMAAGDVGMGQRLAKEHGARIRWVHEWGWLFWDGEAWTFDTVRELQRMAKDTISKTVAYGIDIGGNDAKALIDLCIRTLSKSGINNMVDMAATCNAGTFPIAVRPDLFDRDDHLLNVANGVLDLRSATISKHDPDYFITKKSSIAYTPTAECPKWEEFLAAVQPNQAVRDFLQVMAGYCLTGMNNERKHFLHWGKGSNGKSTFFRALEAILGLEQYAATVDPSTFHEDAAQKVRSDLARLVGRRMVTTTEVRGGQQFDEQLFKRITGGEQINAAFKHKDDFAFKPKFKIHVIANEKPIVREQSQAVWSRVVLVPWLTTIQSPDTRFYETSLEPELPGILAWAVRGAVKFYAAGLVLPGEIRDAIEDYRQEMDVIGPFVGALCFFHKDAKVTNKDLMDAYNSFCADNGIDALKQRSFSNQLLQRNGVSKVRDSSNAVLWKGIALRRSENVDLWNPKSGGPELSEYFQ